MLKKIWGGAVDKKQLCLLEISPVRPAMKVLFGDRGRTWSVNEWRIVSEEREGESSTYFIQK